MRAKVDLLGRSEELLHLHLEAYHRIRLAFLTFDKLTFTDTVILAANNLCKIRRG